MWLRKMRPVLVVIAVMVAVGSLVGARALTSGNGQPTDAKASESAPKGGGTTVLGLVDTDPPPVTYGLPPVLQAGTVSEVFVKDGDEITAEMLVNPKDDRNRLYAFDDRIQQADLSQARAAVAYARQKVVEAQAGITAHQGNIDVAKAGLTAADNAVRLADNYKKQVEHKLKDYYQKQMVPEDKWQQYLDNDLTMLEAKAKYDAAVGERGVVKAKLAQLEALDPQIKVNEAKAALKQAEEVEAKAQLAVDLCVVRARTPGVIEQVSISPGTTIGVATRTPALWLIPSGKRVVRAEVEADFAHRVGSNLKGRTVTIYDHSDPKLTYTGRVTRIGGTFLLKRAAAENLLAGDTRVIEVVVEVIDPTPAGQPPLRVGQRVRVELPK